MNRQTARAADAEQSAAKWNSDNPVGTKGFLLRDLGERHATEVRKPAFVSSSGQVVAFFKNVSGYYLAERFEACPEGVTIGSFTPPPAPHVAGAVELLQEYGQLGETDRGRLIAIARVMRATAP